jgi:hypothetical protein
MLSLSLQNLKQVYSLLQQYMNKTVVLYLKREPGKKLSARTDEY